MDADTFIGGASLFRIRLWGPFRVEKRVGENYVAVQTADWGGSHYPRLLLKALLCCPRRGARREALLEMLWPEMEIEQATANLNTATTKLRHLLRQSKGQESLLVTEDDATIYHLPDQAILWVDSDATHQAMVRAERLGRTSAGALSLLEEAVNLFNRGTFLDGEEGQWAREKRATRERERYRGRIWLAESYGRQGMAGQAEAILTTLLEDDPFDEDALCRLMTLLHGQGMTHQALLLYQQTHRFFKREQMELTEATRNLAAHLEKERQVPLLECPSGADPEEDIAKRSQGRKSPVETQKQTNSSAGEQNVAFSIISLCRYPRYTLRLIPLSFSLEFHRV